MMPGLPLLVDTGKRNLSSVIEWGRRKMIEGAYDVAIQHFTVALDLKPGLIHALVSRGFCHLTLGDEEKAQRDFAEVIAKDAGFNRNVYVLIALCFKRHGDFHTAIRYLTRCVQQFAAFKPALVARGELLLKVREYEKARMDFQHVLLDAPAHLVARRGLGDALRGLGNFREALRHYTKAAEDAVRSLTQQSSKAVQQSRVESDGSGNVSEEAGNSCSSRGGISRDVDIQRAPTNDSIDVDPASYLDEGSDDEPGRGGGAEDGNGDASGIIPPESENMVPVHDEASRAPETTQAFITEVLLRRALLLRLIGDLEGSSCDLLEVLQNDPQNGLALFWYAKVLIEQSRHREAPPFLQACLNHFDEEGDRVHALLGVLLLTRPDPDCDTALRHLREAVRLIQPSYPERSQPIKITMWICAAANALHSSLHDPQSALGYLDKALAALNNMIATQSKAAVRTSGQSAHHSRSPLGGMPKSARGSATPRMAVGSGGNAALALSAGSKSIEEATWMTAKNLTSRRQELAQGDDLDLAFECSSYLQLVAREPQQQMSAVPPLLYALRAMACCDLGRWDECVANCRKALAVDPDDEATQYNMHIASGILRSRDQEYEAAVGRFTKAIRLRPVSNEVRVHRAIALAMAARACGGAHGAPGSPGRDGTGRDVGRAMQLLADAVQDLEAAEQQAMIAGSSVPAGTGCLRAACLCSLGRPDEAWEVLGSCQRDARGIVDSPRRRALEAEVLVLLERHAEAVKKCTGIIESEGSDKEARVAAHLMRGRCWSELGNSKDAFKDFREALVLAPEKAEIHEASGELYLMHRCYGEAITAFNNSAKLAGAFSPRLAYARALAHLSLGNPGACLKDLNRALRLNPNLPAASRARDGSAALQMALDGDFRHAHVRLNVLLHPRVSGSSGAERTAAAIDGFGGANLAPDGLPPLFMSHELVLYRGVCSLYLGDSAAASQDFEAALQLARQTAQVLQQTGRCSRSPNVSADNSASASTGSLLGGVESNDRMPTAMYPPEVTSQIGQDAFECEMLYNITLCHILARDYRRALDTCERLLDRPDALSAIGPSAQCLIWFLVGVCRLALGEGRSDVAREAFMHSYAHDPVYVDDFLRRHEPSSERGYGGPGASTGASTARAGNFNIGSGRPPPLRPLGGCPSPPPGARSQSSRDCDAAAEAVCCLRREKTRLSFRFPPCRLQVKDVVIWGRPSISWPFVRTPELVPAASLARLDILSHQEVGVNPAPPWDRMA
jgi:tetratricopeptide (TPR) repeat protein